MSEAPKQRKGALSRYDLMPKPIKAILSDCEGAPTIRRPLIHTGAPTRKTAIDRTF